MLDAQRPLLRIPLQGGGMVLAARMAGSESSPWTVGISGSPSPMIHELDSADAVVALMLTLLEPPLPTLDHSDPLEQG